MNIFLCIPFFIWVIGSLIQLRKIKKRIDKAREAGDDAYEQEYICKAEGVWGDKTFARFKGSTLTCEGGENLPEGPVLFVSNHQGYGDIIVYLKAASYFNKQVGFVARRNLRKIPFFGVWIDEVRSLLIDRGDARSTIKVFKIGEDLLRRGFNLIIFPEGTRSRSNEMGPFKKGSMQLATRAEVPIVPLTLWNSWQMFERTGRPATSHVRLCVHPAIPTRGMPRKEQAELSDRVESIIRAKLDEWKAAEASSEAAAQTAHAAAAAAAADSMAEAMAGSAAEAAPETGQ